MIFILRWSPPCSWGISKSPVNAESWMPSLPKSSPVFRRVSSPLYPSLQFCKPLNSIYWYIQIKIITFSGSLTSFLCELFQNTFLQVWINCVQAFFFPFGMQWHLDRCVSHQKSLELTVTQTCQNWTLSQWPPVSRTGSLHALLIASNQLISTLIFFKI